MKALKRLQIGEKHKIPQIQGNPTFPAMEKWPVMEALKNRLINNLEKNVTTFC